MEFHIVSHTHWDREWYKTFEEYRIKLIEVVDVLLDLVENNDEYKSFMLDGQTIVLEDYLEIRPENRERLSKLIREKRIIVGPWYIQPDEFIPSGESMVRNLLIGMMIGDKFGHNMKIGYLPDSFGQSVHIPQILNGFDIKDSIVWRGISDEDITEKEFWWKGLDGSKILNHYLPLGYENAKWLSLNSEKNKEVVQTNIEAQQNLTRTGQLLMLCGYDQREANPDIPQIINSLNKEYEEEGHRFKFSTLEEYVDKVRESNIDFNEIAGEFRKGKHMRVHASIGSTRLDIKKSNFEAQSLYEKYLEPIGSLASICGLKYDNSMINHGWKYIIQNQAHDSIGNVCTDVTHDEMEMRYNKAKQIGKTIMEGKLDELSSKVKFDFSKGKPVIIFNTLLNQRKSFVEIEAFLENKEISLVDKLGNSIEFQIIGIEEVDLNDYSIESHFIGKNASQNLYKVKLCFIADVKGYGYTTYYIQNRKYVEDNKYKILNGNTLENEYLAVKINIDGSLNVIDKSSGKTYLNQNIIEESGNAGDEYDYSPPQEDKLIYSKDKDATIETISNGPVMAMVKITHTLNYPKTTCNTGRSKEMKESGITNYISMYKEIKRIEINTVIDNEVENHRIRALFDTGTKTKTHNADQQFGKLKRENYLSQVEYWREEGWQEKYYPIFNHQKYVNVFDGKNGIQIMNKGLPQYEIIGRENPKIALTLLCGTDYMGKQDLVNRPGRRSGLHVETPKSIMLGRFNAEYAVSPIKDEVEMNYLAEDYVYPLEHYMPSHIGEEGDFVDEFYPLMANSKHIGTSAIKKSENDNALIVRFYNSHNEAIDNIKINYDQDIFKEVKLVNFKEEEIEANTNYSIKNSIINIEKMESNEILTFKFNL